MAAAGPVPGRFEGIDAGQPFSVLVDYAHTPDGLEQLLLAAREVAGQVRIALPVTLKTSDQRCIATGHKVAMRQ